MLGQRKVFMSEKNRYLSKCCKKSKNISAQLWSKLDPYRTIHSIKTAIACLIGLAIVTYFRWPMGQWVPITIIVVMSAQARFGGALQKAYMRFLGTAAGVMVTLLTLTFFNHDLVAVFTVIFLSCLVFTYIATEESAVSYAGVLGGVTVVLTLTGLNVDRYYALQRGFYIVVGIIIALLVSRFVFPLHAREKLRDSVANTICNLRNLYFAMVQGEDIDAEKLRLFNVRITKSIGEQMQLISEASLGSRYFAQHRKALFTEIYSSERRLYRLINLMERSLSEAGANEFIKAMHKIRSIEEVHAIIEHSLDNLGGCFAKSAEVDGELNLDELTHRLTLVLQKLPATEDWQKLIGEHSFVFFLQQIIEEIVEMQGLVKKINYE